METVNLVKKNAAAPIMQKILNLKFTKYAMLTAYWFALAISTNACSSLPFQSTKTLRIVYSLKDYDAKLNIMDYGGNKVDLTLVKGEAFPLIFDTDRQPAYFTLLGIGTDEKGGKCVKVRVDFTNEDGAAQSTVWEISKGSIANIGFSIFGFYVTLPEVSDAGK